MRAIAFAILCLVGCSSPPNRTPQQVASASAYCELSADLFCEYYQRCDRMAADSHTECRSTFREACEAVYEPHYVALEQRGDIALSVDGLATCADHLRTVSCDEQINDLDGGCADVWQGLAVDGAACGPGIESFVCGEQSTCVLGLNFCGTCEPTVTVGSACEPGIRCEEGSSCIDASCVADALPGEACGEQRDCVLGAWCADGVCERPQIVAVGEACGQVERCQYRAACVSGSCVQAALLGDSCSTAVPCASGWCDDGTCVTRGTGGVACSSGAQCDSGICDAGSCMALPGVCF